MSTACSHLSMVRTPPTNGTQGIHREECTQCFHSDEDVEGLDVCMTCWNGGCPTKHSQRHASITGHGVVVNIKKTELPVNTSSAESTEKVTKLAIGLPGGIAISDEPLFKYDTKVRCLLCNCDVDATQEAVAKAVAAILEAKSSSQPTAMGWEETKEPCTHTKNLIQQADAPKILTKALSTCQQCNINENLWLCLTCGALGCARAVYGGGGGNGHGKAHYEQSKHPLVMKAGTIKPEGTADIYCYECDRDVIDTDLIKHLKHFGIDVQNEQQTVKTTSELELEFNLNKNWSLTYDHDGKEAQLLFGPGMTGLRNLGNSCYMASVLQVAYNLESIRQRYLVAGTKHLEECRQWRPSDCYQCQMAKLADGLLTGRYSTEPTAEEWEAHHASVKKEKEARAGAGATATSDADKMDTDEKNETTSRKRKKPLQTGIPPRMFKSLVTKNHTDFSGPRQQDAYEFWQYLIAQIQQREKQSGVDPTDVFNFVIENRLECTSCHGVRYSTTRSNEIQLPIPHADEIKNAEYLPEPEAPPQGAGEEEQKKYQRALERYRQQAKTVAPVPFTDCMKEWGTTTFSENWNCPACQKPTKAAQSVRLRTYPEVLVVQMRRFVFDQWVPRKLDVDIILDEKVSFDLLRATGLQSSEKELPSSTATATATTAAPVKVANEAIVSQLQSMGFTKEACTRAALAVDNASADAASNWLFGHMEDPDINDPLPAPAAATATASSTGANEPPAEAVAQLEMMGFPTDRCKYALKQTGNNADRAVDWLFSHTDDVIPTESAQAAPAAAAPAHPLDTAPAGYELSGFILHQGKFTSSGHYIAFVKKDGKWVQFNDEKVSLSPSPPKQHGYLYFFTRIRA